jgi:hypothetical protein
VADSTGSGFQNQYWGHWAPLLWHDVRIGDVTGDGRADVVGRTDGGDWWVGRSTGSGFVNEHWGYWPPNVWSDVHLADVNGPDGSVKNDLVGRAHNGQWWVAKSTGSSLGNEHWGTWSTGLTFGWTVARDGNPYTAGTGANFTFTPGMAGSYQVTLRAADKDGIGTPMTRTITVGSQLPADRPSMGDGVIAPLSDEQLTPVLESTIGPWQTAGLDATSVAALRQVQVSLADLRSVQFDRASAGVMRLDTNAAGVGWDTGPVSRLSTLASPPSYDLLTAVMHELGYILGLADRGNAENEPAAMFQLLEPGARCLPTIADVDAIFRERDWPVPTR